MSFFTNAKDKTPLLNNYFVIHNFTCPGCNINYIGKTEGSLYERAMEHAKTVLLKHTLTIAKV